MFRFWKASLVAVMGLATFFVSAPAANAAVIVGGGPRVVVGGGFYGRGWYGPRWGAGWGGGWYGPWAWGPGYGYYYGPGPGHVKIVTHDKAAAVYVDGGYAGPVEKIHKFQLRPGTHDLELRDPNGQTVYHQRVEVIRGKTTEIHADHTG